MLSQLRSVHRYLQEADLYEVALQILSQLDETLNLKTLLSDPCPAVEFLHTLPPLKRIPLQ